jgi:hypothetical protein
VDYASESIKLGSTEPKQRRQVMSHYIKFIGLDVHKESIAIAVANAAGGEPVFYGTIPNTTVAIKKLVKKLCPHGDVMSFCYEA